MTDRDGVELVPGDPVIYHHDDETMVTATVLRVREDGRYLIQLDPQYQPTDPRADLPPYVMAFLDQHEALMAEAGSMGIDPQEPFVVDGSRLTYNGLWKDNDGQDGDANSN